MTVVVERHTQSSTWYTVTLIAAEGIAWAGVCSKCVFVSCCQPIPISVETEAWPKSSQPCSPQDGVPLGQGPVVVCVPASEWQLQQFRMPLYTILACILLFRVGGSFSTTAILRLVRCGQSPVQQPYDRLHVVR